MLCRPESVTLAFPLIASAPNLEHSRQLSAQPALGCEFHDGTADDEAMMHKQWWHACHKNWPNVTTVVVSFSMPVPRSPIKNFLPSKSASNSGI